MASKVALALKELRDQISKPKAPADKKSAANKAALKVEDTDPKTGKSRISLKESLRGSSNKASKAPPPEVKPTKGSLKSSEGSQRKTPLEVPVAKKVKDILECLFNSEKFLSPSELKEATKWDVEADKALWESILKTEKVLVEGNLLKYKPQHSVNSKQDLLNLIRDRPQGLFVPDIRDGNKNALEYIVQLQKEKKIYAIGNGEPQQEVLFVATNLSTVVVDQDILDSFHSIEIPAELCKLQSELERVRIRSATANQPHKRIAPIIIEKQKKARNVRQRIMTNVHLPNLFAGEQPQQID